MEIRFEKTDKEVTILVDGDNVGLDAQDCGEMAFRDYPGPLVDILDRNEVELSIEQERELKDLCLGFYQANREIAVREFGESRILWQGLEKEWRAMNDRQKSDCYIDEYPDTTFTYRQIVNRLTYGYTN